MKFAFDKIKRLFVKDRNVAPPAKLPVKPSWDEIVAALYDKNLDAFSREVVRVIYSRDRSIRYVVLKDEKERYTYEIEAIYRWDDDEWAYFHSDGDSVPAQWEPFHGKRGSSFFDSEAELLRELMAEPEYRQYFQPTDGEDAP